MRPISKESIMNLVPQRFQDKLSEMGDKMAASQEQHHAYVNKRRMTRNKDFYSFLSSSWPGSILNWTDKDIHDFAGCFRVVSVQGGQEVPIPCGASDVNFFFIIAEGAVEVNALLPTKCKKTGNIREFLCKKAKGDMVYMPSVRKLISESNAREIFERENKDHKAHTNHKNVLDLIDTVGIRSVENSTLLQLDWSLFGVKFGPTAERPEDSKLDVAMLRTIMETNLTDHLAKIPILDGIPHSKLETLSRLCHYCVKKEGSTIFTEGSIGDEVFIILSGEVRVNALASKRMVTMMDDSAVNGCPAIKSTSLHAPLSDSDKEDSSKRKGSVAYKCDYVSEERSCSENKESGFKRKGSVSVCCDYEANSKRLSDAQLELANRRRTMVLAGNSCRREAAKRKLSPNNSSEAESNADMDNHQQSVELATLGEGDYIGEMATFIELPRAATVTATSNVLLAALSKSNFRTLYHSISPELEATLEVKIKSYMLRNIFELKSPFQQRISLQDSDRMAENASITKYEKDSIVFREGWEAKHFYFVYSGTLSAEKNTDGGQKQNIGYLFPGDYFGEMAIINGTKRLATITATSSVVLLEITSEQFNECFKETPGLVAEFIVRMKGKHVDLASLLECKRSRDTFATFHAESENNPAEISFYEEVSAFERDFVGMNLHAWKRAKDIVDKYMTKGKMQHNVDLPESIIKPARERVLFDTDSEVTKDMFTEAKQEVYDRMEEVFETFKKSDKFSSLLDQMRAYDDVDVHLLA